MEFKSKASKGKVDELNKKIAWVEAVDDICAQVEDVVSGVDWSGDRKPLDVSIMDAWPPRAVAVNVWDADPTEVFEKIVTPLHTIFQKPVKTSSMDTFKVFFTMRLDADEAPGGRSLEIVVQVIQPQGCEVVKETREVEVIKCA